MAHEDVAMSALLEECGPESYGVYWLLLETVACTMEKNCASPELTHSELKWAQTLYVSVRKFRRYVGVFASRGLILSETIENRLHISIPKLLKYRDEYSNRSGQAPDKLPARSDTDQIRADTENKEPPIVPQGGPVRVPDQPKTAKTKQRTAIQQEFHEEWPGYWLKRGKDTAERAYEKARKQATREEIHAGVERMGPVLLREAQERGHTPLHPATWLNRGGWKDEVEPHLFPARASPVRDVPPPDTRPLDQIFLR